MRQYGEENDTARQAADGSIIRCMGFECLIPEATDTHSVWVLIIAFPRQHGYANESQCYVVLTLRVLLQGDATYCPRCHCYRPVVTHHLDILGLWTARRAVLVVLSASVMSCQVCFAQFRSLAVHFFYLSPSLILPSVAPNMYPSAAPNFILVLFLGV